MISAAISALIEIIKLWLGWRKKDAAQQVANTDHEMLKDAVDRPDRSELLDELHHHGKF
jgi:hypothetical protein